MSLKVTKQSKDVYVFTGAAFAKACFDADVNAYRMEKATAGHIYHQKFQDWIAQGEKPIEVDKYTMDLILAVLAKSAEISAHSRPQEASKK